MPLSSGAYRSWYFGIIIHSFEVVIDIQPPRKKNQKVNNKAPTILLFSIHEIKAKIE